MTAREVPTCGTPEWEWWAAGAAAEAKARTEGMTEGSREVYECVEVMAQQGRAADEIVGSTARIFTCVWPLRARLELAWCILRGQRRRRELAVYREPRDVWIGYYRGDRHHYVCPLPTVVIRWLR